MPTKAKLHPHFFAVPDPDRKEGQRVTGVRIGYNAKNPDDYLVGLDFKEEANISMDDVVAVSNGIIALIKHKEDKPKSLIVTATPEEVVACAKASVPSLPNRAERRAAARKLK